VKVSIISINQKVIMLKGMSVQGRKMKAVTSGNATVNTNRIWTYTIGFFLSPFYCIF
jgi:hypothetical protein